MSRPDHVKRGWMPDCQYLLRLLGVIAAGYSVSPALAADDPYLELLDREVTKVEPVASDTVDEGRGVVGNDASRPVASKESFETLLRRQHVGTYSFYRRLPERSREEVYLDYRSGASMEVLRGKIIDRYLHP